MRSLKQRFALGASIAVLSISAAAADNDAQPSASTQTPSAQAASGQATPTELAANDAAGVQLAANGSGVEAVTVTARRREEDSQHVPVALSVIGSSQLDATGASNLAQVTTDVPSLQLFSTNPRNTSVNIRGIGNNIGLANDGLEPGVGFYVDQVYYARPGQVMFDLADIDQIEVLRGPQGTLFGKNTTAGALNITTKAPSFTPGGSAELNAGDYNTLGLKVSLTGPILGDVLAGRISFATDNHSGFIRNVVTSVSQQNYQDISVRGQLLYTPASDLTIRVIGDFSSQKDRCCVSLFGGVVTARADGSALPRNFYQRAVALGYTPLPADPYLRETDINGNTSISMRTGGSIAADWDTGPLTLTSVTAYRFWSWYPHNDVDGTGLPIFDIGQQSDEQRQFSQELRVTSNGSNTVDYVGGLYFFRQTVVAKGIQQYGADAVSWLLGPASPAPANLLSGYTINYTAKPNTDSYAAFGQATWHIDEQLSLTAGVRYTYETKNGTFNEIVSGGLDLTGLPAATAATDQAIKNAFGLTQGYSSKENNGAVSGLVNLSYQATDDILTYLTYSRGSKSGGLNLTALPAGISPVVKSETVDAYEAGVKSTLLDRRLTFNAALYWENDKNFQGTLVVPGGVTQYLANIPAVRSRGVETDIEAVPFDWLNLHASAAYDEAVFTNYANGLCGIEWQGLKSSCDLTGRPIPGIPKWDFAFGGELTQPLPGVASDGEGYIDFDYSFRSSKFSAATDSIYSRIGGFGLANFRAGVRWDQTWDASVYLKNAFDRNYALSQGAGGLGNSGIVQVLPGDPRTVGVTLRAHI